MSALDRRSPPTPTAVRAFEFPEVRPQSLENGLELRVARIPRLPVVSAVLVMPAGESMLGEERAGLAVLAGDALDGGTASRTAGELAEAFESIGVALHTSTGWDATTVAFTCVAERLPRALELAADAVRRSAFPEDQVARVRDQLLARVRQRRMDPASLANDWAVKLFYADGVPYGRPLAGTTASLAARGRDDLRAFAQAAYRPRGAGLVLAGDVDVDEAEALAREHLGGWEGQPPARPEVEASPRFRERTLHLLHRPGAVQSELRIGHPGVPRRHEDYFALLLANTVLGGAFTSRLNLSLRERHGFTYGVRSRFAFRRGAGPFAVSTSVGADVTAAAVREVVRELETFSDEGPTAAELAGARDYVAGVFPLRMETSAQVADRVAELLVYGLPEDHHATFRERVREVTLAGAKAAALRHVRPSEATILVVGDAEKVRGPLEALGLGPVRLHAGEDAAPAAS